MMDEYIHLRKRAGDVFQMRYQETIDPDKDRWELCSRVLARRDVVDRLSAPWDLRKILCRDIGKRSFGGL